MSTQPFLSIITRCCKRPKMLAKNIASVKEQSDLDVEQVFIIDPSTRGRLWANQNMDRCKGYLRGEYVYILDDDCRLIHPDFIKRTKEVARETDAEIIMVRCSRPQKRPKVLPRRETWANENRIHGKALNCLCYVVKRDLWNNTISVFGKSVSGAGRFFDGLMKFKPTLAWLRIIAAETMQLGRDGGFEKVKPYWHDEIVRQHHMILRGEDAWVIQHWS